MRQINLALLAFFQLSRARSPAFSIHSDLQAFPNFEVIFAEEYIYEKDAQSLLQKHAAHPTYSAPNSETTRTTDSEGDDERSSGQTSESPAQTYELLKLSSHNYLCSIPVIDPPIPENKTANELAKAEEARELSRATANGWKLLNELDGACLYFILGWWSYSFCNNREIVQFHSLPAPPNGQPPRRDPNSAEYVLGREPALPAHQSHQRDQIEDTEWLPAEIQTKGEQRYLVQKLEGGTICDLTGRERTIEVQYHCVPGLKQDRIGWIKEVTICSYLMAINTPRLCNDVAFLPPKENRANPINCQLIVGDGENVPPLLDHNSASDTNAESDAGATSDPETQQEAAKVAENKLIGKAPPVKKPIVVGGIEVGARNIISGADEPGKPPVKLSAPRSYFGNAGKRQPLQQVAADLVAKAKSKEEGGGVEVLSEEELESMNISPEVIEEMREQMEKLAGDLGWKLEIVKLDGEEDLRELRGYIDGDEEGEQEEEEGTNTGGKPRSNPKAGTKGNGEGTTKGKADDQAEDEGSEEQFFAKEEL